MHFGEHLMVDGYKGDENFLRCKIEPSTISRR